MSFSVWELSTCLSKKSKTASTAIDFNSGWTPSKLWTAFFPERSTSSELDSPYRLANASTEAVYGTAWSFKPWINNASPSYPLAFSTDSSSVTAYIDLKGYGVGEHEVPVKVKGTDVTLRYDSKTSKVKVRISEK